MSLVKIDSSQIQQIQTDPFIRSSMEISESPFGRLRSSLFPSRSTALSHSRLHSSLHGRHSDKHEIVPAGFHDDIMGTFRRMDAMFEEIDNIMRSHSQSQFTVTSGHTYSATSVMTYVNDGRGRPKVYQSSSATCSAPGGIRETRKHMRDSHTGIEKVSVGHHLGDRARVVERSMNHRTGQHDEEIEYVNMDEGEDDAFQKEWRSRTGRHPTRSKSTYQKQPIYEERKFPESDSTFSTSSPYRRLALTDGSSTANAHTTATHGHKPTST